jgi:hypothetical protein
MGILKMVYVEDESVHVYLEILSILDGTVP